jgi:hypothetical protein
MEGSRDFFLCVPRVSKRTHTVDKITKTMFHITNTIVLPRYFRPQHRQRAAPLLSFCAAIAYSVRFDILFIWLQRVGSIDFFRPLTEDLRRFEFGIAYRRPVTMRLGLRD